MEYIYPQASIECLSAELVAKKFIPTGSYTIPHIGTVKKYNLTRNSLAKIIRCLACDSDKTRKESHTSMNDIIKGESLYVLTKTKGILRPKKVGGYTSSHGTNSCTTDDFTFAQIKVAFPANILDPKQIPPSQ